jgi:hypothetical protein
MTPRPRSGWPGVSLALFCPLPGQIKEQRVQVSCASLPWQRSLAGAQVALLRSLILQPAKRIVSSGTTMDEFVKVRWFWANVKELQWTFSSR